MTSLTPAAIAAIEAAASAQYGLPLRYAGAAPQAQPARPGGARGRPARLDRTAFQDAYLALAERGPFSPQQAREAVAHLQGGITSKQDALSALVREGALERSNRYATVRYGLPGSLEGQRREEGDSAEVRASVVALAARGPVALADVEHLVAGSRWRRRDFLKRMVRDGLLDVAGRGPSTRYTAKHA